MNLKEIKIRPRLILIILIIVIGAGVRSQNLFEPWVGMHNAWGGATLGNIARNYVKYGYLATQFGPVANSGYVTPDKFEYYYHYPPLAIWLVSISYQIFGVHEWSTRLVPLLFSISLMGLIFLFARHLFTENLALAALLFCAIMPIENYYGAHVDFYSAQAVFLSLLALYGYVRWLENYRTVYLEICTIGVVLGCLTGWYTYFLIPLILVHYYFFYFFPGKSRYHRLLIIAISAAAIFGLFLIHRQILLTLENAEVHGTLIEKVLLRTSWSSNKYNMTPWMIFLKHFRDVVRLYSPPLIILSAVWGVLFIVDGWKKRLQNSDWFILILLSYGFLHNLAFPSLIPGHDYLTVCYTPGIALAAAVVFIRSCRYVKYSWGVKARNGFAVILLSVIVVAGLYQTQRLISLDDRYTANTSKQWGETIRKNTENTDVILMPAKEDAILKFYVDRKILFETDSPQKIIQGIENEEVKYHFVCPLQDAETYKELLNYLDTKYQRKIESNLIIYNVRNSISGLAKVRVFFGNFFHNLLKYEF